MVRSAYARLKGDFTHSGSVGAKRIPLHDLDRKAQARLERIQFDDADALWELGVGGQPRLWDVRDGNCFRFPWWDPIHSVCPSLRR